MLYRSSTAKSRRRWSRSSCSAASATSLSALSSSGAAVLRHRREHDLLVRLEGLRGVLQRAAQLRHDLSMQSLPIVNQATNWMLGLFRS